MKKVNKRRTAFKNGQQTHHWRDLLTSDLNQAAETERCFLAHRIRISEILHWDRKSYLTHAILPTPRGATYIGCIGTHAHGRQVTSLLC